MNFVCFRSMAIRPDVSRSTRNPDTSAICRMPPINLTAVRPKMSVMIASQIRALLVATVPPTERQNKGEFMTRILLLGLDPETVDYSDPALPPGMTAEKVRAGIAIALKQFTDRGWESDVGYIRPAETAGPIVERQLRSTNYDCVGVGGGVSLPP